MIKRMQFSQIHAHGIILRLNQVSVRWNSQVVFNRKVKRIQRDHASTLGYEFDYLRDEISRCLVDRLLDIKVKDHSVCVDVGCGTGNIGKQLGDKSEIKSLIHLELSRGMLLRDLKDIGFAKSGARLKKFGYLADVPSYRKTYHVVADEEYLPLQPNSVDIALSCLSMHWVNDLPGLLSQIERSLKPNGLFLGAMLGGSTLQELRSAFTVADLERRGGVSPHISPFTESRDIGDLLSTAGFNLPTVDTDIMEIPYPDMFTLIDHLKGMGESNAPVTPSPFVSRDVFLAAASAYDSLYSDEDGFIPATFQVFYMIGWKRHESQQKPMKRGSATHSFKDIEDIFPPEKEK